MADKIVSMFDFSGGIINARVNPLQFPADSFYYGENINIINHWAETRPGMQDVLNTAFAAGNVRYLSQHIMPASQIGYFLAQVDTTGASKLYASATQVPSTAVTFSEVYDLGATAGPITTAQLNDRVIITEGIAQSPLVFSGGLDSTGADWAVPKQILGSVDSGVTFFDMTSQLCDADTSTSTEYPNIAGMTLYICVDTPILTGLYFGVTTANDAVSTMTGTILEWGMVNYL